MHVYCRNEILWHIIFKPPKYLLIIKSDCSKIKLRKQVSGFNKKLAFSEKVIPARKSLDINKQDEKIQRNQENYILFHKNLG